MHARKYPQRAFILLGVALLSFAWREAHGRARALLAGNETPVEIYAGYLAVVRGSANGVGNLQFLLDTGATDTAIDRTLADKLELRTKPTKVTSFDKTTGSEWAALAEISFGPERVPNVRVLIEDLSYFNRIGVHLDGVIGLDQLRRQSFLLSYAKKIYAKKSSVFGLGATAEIRGVPMLANDHAIRVEAELDGRPVWMVADTGAPLTVLYEDTLKDLAVSYRLEGRMDWLSLAGHVESRIAIVPRFRLGKQDLERDVILVSVSRAKKPNGVSGYLGVASLEAREVVFDFETNQFLWRK
jgi:predicted aspartyl protease